jgi:hypothetical protein
MRPAPLSLPHTLTLSRWGLWRDVLPAVLLLCKLLTFSAGLLSATPAAAPLSGLSSSPHSRSPTPAADAAVAAAPSPSPAPETVTAAGTAHATASADTALRPKCTPRLTLRVKLIAAAYIAEAMYWLAACAWVEPALPDGYGADAGISVGPPDGAGVPRRVTLDPCAPTRSTAWRRKVRFSFFAWTWLVVHASCLPACPIDYQVKWYLFVGLSFLAGRLFQVLGMEFLSG